MTASSLLQQTQQTSNLTFGYANDEAYLTQNSVTLTAESNFTYSLSSFGFGPVY